ncbi:unnamed protein product [Urochloa humidicola]
MVLGLGGCCGGVAVAAASPAAARQSAQEGDALDAKQQQKVIAGEDKQDMGGEPGKVAAAGKERNKRGHQRAAPVVMHKFPFHSRPGML